MYDSFEKAIKDLGLPTDDKCYKVGLTLACRKCLYQKTSDYDNYYAEYVVPCGAENHFGTGELQVLARNHAENCPYWNMNKEKPAVPHPEADKQFGKTSFCAKHGVWKCAIWPGAPAHMAWKGPEGANKKLLFVVENQYELWQLT